MADEFGTGSAAASGATLAKLRLEQVIKSGAGWFVWVAALSMVNSLISSFGGSIRFIFGLGITQVVDAISHQAGNTGVVLDLVINGFVAGLFVLFWNFARKGERWAFLVGMVLYALDGLLLIMFKDILGIAFHAYALWRIYQGYAAANQLQALSESNLAMGGTIQPR